MPRNDFTAIAVVLDRSGSMATIKNDTIGGFNEFLKTQKDAEGHASMILAQFDHEYEIVHNFIDIREIPELTDATYTPRGGTALLDAMGRTISELKSMIESMEEDERPANIVVVVQTDGEENSSKEFTKDVVFESVKKHKDDYNWEFIFLGADEDAISVGQSYGFNTNSSVVYASNLVGDALHSVGAKTQAFRSARSKGLMDAKISYSASDRDALVGKDSAKFGTLDIDSSVIEDSTTEDSTTVDSTLVDSSDDE